MNKKSLMLGVLALVLLAGGGWWWRTKSASSAQQSQAAAPKPPQTVTLFTARQQDMPVRLEAAATVVALNSVELRPQLSTTVKRVAIREGQFVRKGELIFSFDDRAEQANLEKARATLLRDRATLADLDRQWRRAQDLRAQNFIAQSAADSVLSQVDAQRALVASDEAAVRAAEVNVGFASLRAPMNGRTGAITVNPGSLVQPGGAALVTISQIDPIGVAFSIPESQLAALLVGGASADKSARGAKVSVLLSGGDRKAPAQSLEGVVSFIDNSVDTTSGTIRLKAELPNAKQQLWPGQFVTVRLTLRTLKNAVVLPQSALILRGQDRQVYVVGADGTAELRKVQLRYASGEFAAVDGVEVGERVVLEGKQNLRPGNPVKEAPAADPPASGAAAVSAGAAVAASAASGMRPGSAP